jgi:hypothetical protein
MSDIIYIVECPQGFNDFSILKQHVPAGGRVEVNPSQFNQMKMSDPTVVAVDSRMSLSEEGQKLVQAEMDKKARLKEEIAKKHKKDAPPRRKKGSGGKTLGALDTRRGVSAAELVHLPVTPKGNNGD